MSIRLQDYLWSTLGELRYQPTPKRVRAAWGDIEAVDSSNAMLVWEPRRVVPSYAVPIADVLAALDAAEQIEDAASGDTSRMPILHPGIPFSAHTAPGTMYRLSSGDGAHHCVAFRPDDEALHDHILLDFDGFDIWLEEDEVILGHPRDPYHRVDVRASSRHVRVEIEGTVVADSSRPLVAFETNLPIRFYLPREDVLLPLLPSSTLTYCPYKGEASYFAVEVDGLRLQDLIWSYVAPLPDAVALAGYVAFYDERVDLTVDDATPAPARQEFADAIRDEFGLSSANPERVGDSSS